MAADTVWSQWHHDHMVHILPDWQYIVRPHKFNHLAAVAHGVPQGLVLSSILFLLYVDKLLQLIKCHQLVPHAENTQTTVSVDHVKSAYSLTECPPVLTRLLWIRANRLQANPSKIEVLWCSTSHHKHQIPTTLVQIGTTDMLLISSGRELGVYIKTHVIATVAT